MRATLKKKNRLEKQRNGSRRRTTEAEWKKKPNHVPRVFGGKTNNPGNEVEKYRASFQGRRSTSFPVKCEARDTRKIILSLFPPRVSGARFAVYSEISYHNLRLSRSYVNKGIEVFSSPFLLHSLFMPTGT